jgi:hypothetical protein
MLSRNLSLVNGMSKGGSNDTPTCSASSCMVSMTVESRGAKGRIFPSKSLVASILKIAPAVTLPAVSPRMTRSGAFASSAAPSSCNSTHS